MIHDLRKAWRWLSVQAAAVVGLIAVAAEYFPDVQVYLPGGWVKWAALVIILARVVKQKERK